MPIPDRKAHVIAITICFLSLMNLCQPAAALIISSTEDLSVTEQDPANLPQYNTFPYWENIGWRGTSTGGTDGSAVYLGGSYVLTANHVGAGKVMFGSTTYYPVPGSAQRIASVDLLVFRVASPPSLPSVSISDANLFNGMDVLMLGTGLDQEEPELSWNIDRSTNPWTWTLDGSPTNATGYQWGTSRIKRWGTNEIFDTNGWGGSATENFLTSFGKGDTTYEAQAADKDSGASLFVNNSGDWELAGLISSVLNYSGQPSQTSVDWLRFPPSGSLGGDQTLAADLTFYRQDILDAMPSVPVIVMGDTNLDGYVDDSDLSLLLANWRIGSGWFQGDFNDDGNVDDKDLSYLLANWTGVPPPVASSGVPEPVTAAMLLVGTIVLLIRRKRKV